MYKKGVLVFSLLAIAIVSIGLASAGVADWFKVTGKVTSTLSCIDGTIGYWPFENGADDISANNYDGTLNGQTTSGSGKVGSSLSFAGNAESYMVLPNAVLDGRVQYTLSMWIKTSGEDDALISVANSVTTNEVLVHRQEEMFVRVKGDKFAFGDVLNDNTWHHLAISIDHSSGKIEYYVDGQLKNTGVVKQDPTRAEGIVIGQDQDVILGGYDPLQSYAGNIDELAIFNKILSATEVANIYNNGAGKEVCSISSGGGGGGGSNSTVPPANTCTNSDGVVETKEIGQGLSAVIAGLNIKVLAADESPSSVTASILVDEREYNLSSSSDSVDILYNGIGYIVKLVSASETDATLKVSSQRNYNIKGTVNQKYNGNNLGATDSCTTSVRLKEYYCDPSGNYDDLDYESYTCPNGCSEGACIADDEPEEENICIELIDKVKNPEDFYDRNSGTGYVTSWNNTDRDYMYVNDRKEMYNMHYSSWYGDSNDGYSHISYNVYVFDNNNIDLEGYIEDRMIDNDRCRKKMIGNNEDYGYVCNYNLYNEDETEGDSKHITWYNGNVLVEIYYYSGRSLTEAERREIESRKISEFVDDLKNNDYEGVYLDFEIPYQIRGILNADLRECYSEISDEGVDDGNTEEGEECVSNWAQCKVEPAICPEYGYQKKICYDSCTDEPKEETIYCSPGICSGCYNPRWLGSRDNICIPYGIRFEKESGMEQKLVEVSDDETLPAGSDGGYKLEVNSPSEATLTFYESEGDTEGQSYNLVEGETITITLPDWDDEINTIDLRTDRIYYSDTADESYVEVTINFQYLENVVQTINAYCDIDGQVKQQRTKEGDGSWASCQNNYECESNLCSGGECVEINDAIRQAKGFKGMFVKVVCRLSNMFDSTDYNQCIAENLG